MIKQNKILLSLAMGALISAPSAQAFWTQVTHSVSMNSSGASVTSVAMGQPIFPMTIRNFVNVVSTDKPNVRDEYGSDQMVLYPGAWYNMSMSSDMNAGRGKGFSNTSVFTASGIVGYMGTMIDTSNFAPDEIASDAQSDAFF